MSEFESETLREVTPSLDDGRYTVISVLKEGRLYLAERAGKRFVLKTAAGAKGLELLKREYELSIGLSHPALAYVFTWEEASPVGPCLVQEFVDGRPLAAWLAEKPSLKERRRIFGELLAVVVYLHGKGVIHNDLTPENILVARTGNALKLIDLGFADSDAYAQKALGGTRGYASPELIAGGTVVGGAVDGGSIAGSAVSGSAIDARSDIYSLGALMRDIFPGRYGRIVRRCMRTDPARRYQSVSALERALARRSLPLKIALAALLAGLMAWPFFRGPRVEVVEVESQALRTVVDSLQNVLDERDRAEAELNAALTDAKAKVDAVYRQAATEFRKALRSASTPQDVTDAWLAFTERTKTVNYEIPAASPEPVRPALRDYIIERSNSILPQLSEEMASRLNELQNGN